jgi:DNA-binding phage protein
MALTKTYKTTVLARIQREPKFARALYAEALNALIEGEVAAGLSMLRDLVHARMTFKTLATETGFNEKALHRMLSKRGNPRSQNLFTITRALREELGVKPHVTVHA